MEHQIKQDQYYYDVFESVVIPPVTASASAVGIIKC